jgi:hypothetical protein
MNFDNILSLKSSVSRKKKIKATSIPLELSTKFSLSKLHSNYANKMKKTLQNTIQAKINKNITYIHDLSESPGPREPHISTAHNYDEILPTIKWESTSEQIPKPENENRENDIEKIGFIILRHVNNSTTNEYWKECYRCIKQHYPKNRILIIDDNSDYNYISNLPLDNTMIIRSEFPKRGEFLPYYYFLKTRFCETAVILHDSVFIKKYINFNVKNYRILWHFEKESISDPESFHSQKNMILKMNNSKLIHFYNTKDTGIWQGCFGAMSVITYDYLKKIDSEFRISCLIPHILCRNDRCAFERVLACLLQINYKSISILGCIHTYCKWGLRYDQYLNMEYNTYLPVVKVWTGR